jgi:hypothetical protein
MRTAIALFVLALSAASLLPPGVAHAENPVGRYEMVALPNKPGSFDNRVMILDTADGHLWQWWEAPAMGSLAPSSGITYLGKVTPGNTSAETVPTRHSGAPEPVMPHH